MKYFDESTIKQLWDLLWFVIIHLGVLILALLVWTGVWLKKFGYDIYQPVKIVRRRSEMSRAQALNTVKIHEFFRYWKEVLVKIIWFDSRFWQNLSPDIYLFLKLERMLIILTIEIFLLSVVCVAIASNFDEHIVKWNYIVMSFLTTVVTLVTVLQLRSSLRGLAALMNPYTDVMNSKWLVSHTLYFGGMLKKDTKGRMLESILNEFLEYNNGRIIKPDFEDIEDKIRKSQSIPRTKIFENKSVLVMKNCKKFTKIEAKRRYINTLLQFLGSEEPILQKCCNCRSGKESRLKK